ncbi:putative membrane protein [Pullulanibacillus pueri]|nr:putative membrane protein [Pullulanibacillus pueri]
MKMKSNRRLRKRFLFYILGILCIFLASAFTNHNDFLYHKPIAEVIKAKTVKTVKQVDALHNKDTVSSQSITAKIKNGKDKGQLIHLNNTYSSSEAYDQKYEVGTSLFVSIDKEEGHPKLTGDITGVKRDKPLVIIYDFSQLSSR